MINVLAEIDLEKDVKNMLRNYEEDIKEISDEEVLKIKPKKGETLPTYYDVIFKEVFLNNPSVLLKMIKEIFHIKEEINNPLTIVGYESVPLVYNGRTFKSDLLVVLSDDSYVVIEMNNKSKMGVLDRNLIQLFRVHSQILKRGELYDNLKNYRIRGINFNHMIESEGSEIEEYAFCNIKTGEVASNIITYVDIDVEKCYNLVYNYSKEKDIPIEAKWGAIIKERSIDRIIDILGGVLTMEEKENLRKTYEDINDDTHILKSWIVEDNLRWKFEEQEYNGYQKGKLEGIEQGAESKTIEMIKNLLFQDIDYNIISSASGKTIEEIKEIEKNMKEE